MWLGLLFSILSLVMLGSRWAEDEPPEDNGNSSSLAELYRLRVAQCLKLGDITKGLPYTLETMIFYSLVEGIMSGHDGSGVWIMWGMMGRVALQMGYHR
jgi:hypothetical protein